MNKKVIILADGRFPEHKIPLGYLKSADIIICCDGAVEKLLDYGLEPSVIAGDMDSIPSDLKDRYSDILYADTEDQDSNDLTKAIRYCNKHNLSPLTIVGASGLREDHTIGNISLLLEYADFLSVKMVTDRGIFIPVSSGMLITSWPGQQVSVFSNKPDLEISSEGLRYPLKKIKLKNWWKGTLNEADKDQISFDFRNGKILIFLSY